MHHSQGHRFLFGIFLAAALNLVAGGRAATGAELAGRRVLVLGDSITQDGRYVSFLEYYLRRQTPAIRCDLVSIGLGSETLSGLTEVGHPYPRPCVLTRLERALDLTRPEVVFVCYGMNDGIYHPPSRERFDAFEKGLSQAVGMIRARGARVVLITPPMFDARPIHARLAAADATSFGYGAPYANYDDGVLAAFARHELAHAAGDLQVIDLHSAMNRAVAERRLSDPEFTFARDGVHPGDEGHLFMAREIGARLGLTLPPESSLATELARVSADPVYPLIAARRKARSEAWLAYVGYTRERTVSAPDADAGEAEAARLEQQITALLGAP